MKRILYCIAIILGVVIALSSCQKKIEKEYNWAYPVAGDWKLKAYIDGDEIYGPFEIKIYNTSFGQDSVWIDDYNGNFWDMKFKAKVDMSTLTFQTAGSVNAISGYDITIKVTDGKIINKDSIYFNMEFEDDPGTIYTLAGHRAVGYDDYMQD